MPRYFIDLHDGKKPVRDTVGDEFPNLAAARVRAVGILTKVAQRFVDEPGRQDLVAAIRDPEGAVRLRLRVSLDASSIGDEPKAVDDGSEGKPHRFRVWTSSHPDLRCFLIAVEHRHRSAPVYAVLSNTADEALEMVANAVAPRAKVRQIGGLSKRVAQQLQLVPREVRLIG